MKSRFDILVGDCRQSMKEMPAGQYHCCVTSPPYFGLRDYKGEELEIGKEASPVEFVAAMRSVFGGKSNPVGVWRVLRDDGILWLNLGDSYSGTGKSGGGAQGKKWAECGMNIIGVRGGKWRPPPDGLKRKDLIGIPWRVAFALQADGWYLRDAIIWHKPAPMPGSQRDRCTSSYEFIFQLTKSARYYYNMDASKEPGSTGEWDSMPPIGGIKAPGNNGNPTYSGNRPPGDGMRTPRNVWTMAHEGYKDAHFATFPIELPTRCIKASTSIAGCCRACGMVEGCGCGRLRVRCRVLDVFCGAGTTGVASALLDVDFKGCELNPTYVEMAKARIKKAQNPHSYRDMNDSVPAELFRGDAG